MHIAIIALGSRGDVQPYLFMIGTWIFGFELQLPIRAPSVGRLSQISFRRLSK